MGIKGFSKAFGDAKTSGKLQELSGKCVGVDISLAIYRASLGMKNVEGLTDKNGDPTAYLNSLLCTVSKYKKHGIKGLLYIFDAPVNNPIKAAENKKRSDASAKAELAKATTVCDKKMESLKKQTFTLTPSMVENAKKLLSLMGVAYITARDGYEAEHLGAQLTIDGILDTIITSDSDAIMFGAKSMYKQIKGGKFDVYNVDTILAHYKITRKQLAHAGVVLGCDFAKGVRGIGVKTVLTKGLSAVLTDEQKNARDYFLKKCPYTHDDFVKNVADHDKLTDWLVNDKNFDRGRVTRLLSQF